MPFTAEHDNSVEKRRRRAVTLRLVRKYKFRNICATNFPEKSGREFARKLGVITNLTIVERKGFKKDTPEDALQGFVTKVPHKDIFHQILFGEYDFLDLDLCNGLPENGVLAVEQCTSWKAILLTVSNHWHGPKGQKCAWPKGTHVQNWLTEWCERNNWGRELSRPFPYYRPNKNARMGYPDRRSPVYITYLITRS